MIRPRRLSPWLTLRLGILHDMARIMIPVFVALALLASVACRAKHRFDGVIIDADGRLHRATPENAAEVTAERLARALAPQAALEGRLRATIHPLPERDRSRPAPEQWRWQRASVTLDVIGDVALPRDVRLLVIAELMDVVDNADIEVTVLTTDP